MTMVCGTLAGSRIELASVSPFWRNVMRQAAVSPDRPVKAPPRLALAKPTSGFAVSGADGETFEGRLAFHKAEQGG